MSILPAKNITMVEFLAGIMSGRTRFSCIILMHVINSSLFLMKYHCSKEKKSWKKHAWTINVTMLRTFFIYYNKNNIICNFSDYKVYYLVFKCVSLLKTEQLVFIFKSKLLGKNKYVHVLIFKNIFSNRIIFLQMSEKYPE